MWRAKKEDFTQHRVEQKERFTLNSFGTLENGQIWQQKLLIDINLRRDGRVSGWGYVINYVENTGSARALLDGARQA